MTEPEMFRGNAEYIVDLLGGQLRLASDEDRVTAVAQIIAAIVETDRRDQNSLVECGPVEA